MMMRNEVFDFSFYLGFVLVVAAICMSRQWVQRLSTYSWWWWCCCCCVLLFNVNLCACPPATTRCHLLVFFTLLVRCSFSSGWCCCCYIFNPVVLAVVPSGNWDLFLLSPRRTTPHRTALLLSTKLTMTMKTPAISILIFFITSYHSTGILDLSWCFSDFFIDAPCFPSSPLSYFILFWV